MNLLRQIKSPDQDPDLVEEILFAKRRIEEYETLIEHHSELILYGHIETQLSFTGPEKPVAMRVKRVHLIQLIQGYLIEAKEALKELEKELKRIRQ